MPRKFRYFWTSHEIARAHASSAVGDRFVDYDESGWVIGMAVVKQLETPGLKVAGLDFLLHEKCFTEEEIRLYVHPCKSGSKARRTLPRLWVESGGGIGGEALR